MKYSLNWLREFVDVRLPQDELSRRLLMLGFEVASVETTGPKFQGVVTAEVLDVRAHADPKVRIRLCDVSDGTQTYKVVCGAPNVAKGQKVAFAKIGAVLPGGMKIAAAKIRGEESHGMICSVKELDLGGDAQGILVLPETTPLGVDFASTLGGSDTILDVEVTPNRPDVLSHYGLARELAWALGLELKTPKIPEAPGGGPAPLKVTVEDNAACPRYTGRSFDGLKVGPSPKWLADRLVACGLRPINNLVDITNYVLLEYGHPLHIFDVTRLKGPEIRVRRAKAGESIAALDGREYKLDPKDLVIADAENPVALAGVIGGTPSSVDDATTKGFLEAAYFAPAGIRTTARRLRIRTDSSYRFERGADVEAATLASARATQLVLELCGGKVGAIVDVYAKAPRPVVDVTLDGLAASLGMPLEAGEVELVLKGLDPKLSSKNGGWTVTAPSHRVDLNIAPDVAEEVGRILGYDRIPATVAPFRVEPQPDPAPKAWNDVLSDRLRGLGFFEAKTYDFLSEKDLTSTGLSIGGPKLANATSTDWLFMRPSLLPGLLRSVRHNFYRGATTVRLAESGKAYENDGERLMLGVIAAGADAAHWSRPSTAPDYAYIKGVADAVLSGLVDAKPGREAAGGVFHPKRSGTVEAGGKVVARFGQVHPAALKAWEVPDAWYLEFDVEALPGRPPWSKPYQKLSLFPSSNRDLSITLPLEKEWSEVEAAVRKAVGGLLAAVTLIDVFSGGKIPAGHRSLTLRLTLASEKKTLSEEEIQGAVQRALDALTPLGAALRS